MSVAVLLKKTRAQYNISGRSKNAKMGLQGPHGKNDFASKGGGGFSLNGPYRNKGRVGSNSLFSPVRSQNLVQVYTRNGNVSVKKGWGGCCGEYNGDPSLPKNIVNKAPIPNSPCCDDTSRISKPSVLNTKGMLALKNKWKKTHTNLGDYPGQIQTIYNRWVKPSTSNNYNQQKTSGQYTQKIAVNTVACNPANLDINSGKKTCNTENFRQSYHIGGKLIPCTPYTKNLDTSNRNINNNIINKRGGLDLYGWQKPYPPISFGYNQCSKRSTQVTDPFILNSYYADANKPRPCKKIPLPSTDPNKKGCYFKVPGKQNNGCQ